MFLTNVKILDIGDEFSIGIFKFDLSNLTLLHFLMKFSLY